jgi:hypothetical protein
MQLNVLKPQQLLVSKPLKLFQQREVVIGPYLTALFLHEFWLLAAAVQVVVAYREVGGVQVVAAETL